jgi:hypothetical protein
MSLQSDTPAGVAESKANKQRRTPRALPQSPGRWKSVRMATAISFGLHIAILLALGMFVIEKSRLAPIEPIQSAILDKLLPTIEVKPPEPMVRPDARFFVNVMEDVLQAHEFNALDPPSQPVMVTLHPANDSSATRLLERSNQGTVTPGSITPHGDHFSGRSPDMKGGLIARTGGTVASEAAVARGLVWLKNHQLPDGSWNFDHSYIPGCNCKTPGWGTTMPSGATALALMAFLGAGQTHVEGDYQQEVGRGLGLSSAVCRRFPFKSGRVERHSLLRRPLYYSDHKDAANGGDDRGDRPSPPSVFCNLTSRR